MHPHRTRSRRRQVAPQVLNVLRFELLERREMFAFDFVNAFNRFDVDNDGYFAPSDVLMIINDLNSRGARSLTPTDTKPTEFCDINGDLTLNSQDALQALQQLNLLAGTSPSLAITGGLTPESDGDGNGVVLQSRVTFAGHTAANAKVRMTGVGQSAFETVADTSGNFQFTVDVSPGITTLRIVAADETGRGMVAEQDVRYGDAVLDWNAVMLQAIRSTSTLPPMAARNLAMVHTAIFDAVNGITGDFQPYKIKLTAPADASPVAAAAAAAQRVAASLYPAADQVTKFNAALAESLAIVPDGLAEDAGVTYGRQVADAILALRANDGASVSVTYVPGELPGDWSPTFPDFLPAVLPQWPNLTPFAMTSGSQFRPSAPPALTSVEYAANVDEVMRLGSAKSIYRTEDQTSIAKYWADGGGTFTPPGHWNQIAADVVTTKGSSLVQSARVFALLNVALADAGIVSWDAKYTYDLWRPIDAIREADTDGNSQTIADPSWVPLLKTPAFPTYTSGHSTFSGAASSVLVGLFGSQVGFTSYADSHTPYRQRPTEKAGLHYRSFTGFAAAADEAGMSRIYGGIHFQFDNSAGLSSGRSLGSYVVSSLMLPK